MKVIKYSLAFSVVIFMLALTSSCSSDDDNDEGVPDDVNQSVLGEWILQTRTINDCKNNPDWEGSIETFGKAEPCEESDTSPCSFIKWTIGDSLVTIESNSKVNGILRNIEVEVLPYELDDNQFCLINCASQTTYTATSSELILTTDNDYTADQCTYKSFFDKN